MAYQRITHDEWEIEQQIPGCAWVVVNTEMTRADGLRSLREYRENMSQYPARMRKRRVPNEES